MAKKHLVKITYYDFLKLLWAVVIFFLAFMIWVKEWWEPSSIIERDYYEEFSGGDSLDKSISSDEEHGAALDKSTAQKLASVCALHQDWCNKIVWSGYFSDYDKIWYVSQYFVIFNFLDRGITEGSDIKKQFKTLVINSNAGKRRWGCNMDKNYYKFGFIYWYFSILASSYSWILTYCRFMSVEW